MTIETRWLLVLTVWLLVHVITTKIVIEKIYAHIEDTLKLIGKFADKYDRKLGRQKEAPYCRELCHLCDKKACPWHPETTDPVQEIIKDIMEL